VTAGAVATVTGDEPEEAGVATAGGAEPAASAEDGAPVGPSESEEAAFLAEQATTGGGGVTEGRTAPAAEEAETPTGELPPLEELVNRIPAPTRQVMDELFRAKFVTVKRVPKSALKG
jgi:hypothetical protein